MQFKFFPALLLFAVAPIYAAEADAVAISANLEAKHLPFGIVVDPIFSAPNSDQIVNYTRCGDSALWTGAWLAAESFRYQVTHDPVALNKVRKAIAGLKRLVDVTGTDLLARCAVPVDSPYVAGISSEEATHGIRTNPAMGLVWAGNTSRDQYTGALFGLAVAFDMVDDAEVRASVSSLVTRMLDFLSNHSWTVVMPDGSASTTFIIRPDQMLAFLQIGRRVNPSRFSTTYDVNRVLLAASVITPIGIEVQSDDSYFKFNLDYMNFYNLLRLESSVARSLYSGAYGVLRSHTDDHMNAFFNMIDRAVDGPKGARDLETIDLLDQWLTRPRRDQSVNLRNSVAVCGNEACQPIPVPLRPPSDFLWQRNPRQLEGGGNGFIENAGIDYILPYWMARYYGVFPSFAVQSAAAPTSTIAPDSIGSIFGSNLASRTEQALSSVLPTTLAGVSVTVKDAFGAERSVQLMYVSPNQINFVLPALTLPGAATFTVKNGSATTTGVKMVQRVSPSIFTMNGAGSGVAAATALRSPQLTPVTVFSCQTSGCASVPIDLDGNSTVYVALYGTGLRNRSALANVKATVNGLEVPVLYAGSQSEYPGLDQVNITLPQSLRGSGEASIMLTMDGQSTNPVTINIR